jgi:2'-5' RNA ligase
MRSYAFIGFLDENTEQLYQEIWTQLYQLGISDYGKAMKMEAHLTFSDFVDVELDWLIEKLDKKYKEAPSIEITLTQLGMFLGSQTLFFAPTQNKALKEFHAQHHRDFDAFISEESMYNAHNWVPHITIASGLMGDSMEKTINILKETNKITCQICRLALCEVFKNEKGRVTSVNTLWEVPLINR